MKFTELGPYFKAYREALGISANAVATNVHVNHETITMLENGETNMKFLGMLDDMMKFYHMEVIPIGDHEHQPSLRVDLSQISPAHRKVVKKIIEDENARQLALNTLEKKK